MNRRNFIRSIGLFGGMLIPIGNSAFASLSPSPLQKQKKLIVVFLRGAIDGLSVVVPHADHNYYQARPTIAIPKPRSENGAINLDGYFGLHPALKILQPLWQERKLNYLRQSRRLIR